MGASKVIKFGTDGWRAVIARDFTFENVRIVSQAISLWLKRDIKKQLPRKVAIGFDSRFLSESFAREVACVLAANGIKVTLSDRPIPTPTVSFTVKKLKFDAGIMITASHNPAQFNGIKIKTSDGAAAPETVTRKVEGYLKRSPVKLSDFNRAREKKEIIVDDLSRDYIRFLRKYLNLKKFKTARFKVLVDVMHGSGDSYMAQVLKGTGIKLNLMRADVNPSFGGKRPEPVVENLSEILHRMKTEGFDLGLVLDGDADRIAAVAAGGEFIHPQKILALLALHLIQDRGESGGIVKTIAGTMLMDNLCRDLNLKLYETPVGFKYISELMTTKDILVGGEEAGGMGFKNYIPERDGTLAGLLLLEMMIYRRRHMGRIVKEMESRYGRFYYLRADLKLKKKGQNLDKIKGIKLLAGKKVTEVKDYDGIKLICEDLSWLMFRASGTEPLMRVYAEASTLKRAGILLKLGEKIIRGL